MNCRRTLVILLTTLVLLPAPFGWTQENAKQLRVGIIGLDTSHAIAFTKVLNDPNAESDVAHCSVVAAYPQGSPDIESSVSRVPKYTQQIQELGVRIVPSIDALVEHVDCVLLETNDGRPHLQQVLPVLRAGKRCFIDKPIAGSLTDAIAVFKAADEFDVPVFSASSLRFANNTKAVQTGGIGVVNYCQTQSPCTVEPTHPDLFWYGIHGVESLFTVMGTGCESVRRTTTEEGKIEVIGTWSGNRTGIYREGEGFGGIAKGSNGEAPVGAYDGYRPLVVEIVRFFRTGQLPVHPAETLEIYAFMEAADESKRQGGKHVSLKDVLDAAGKTTATFHAN